MKWWLEVWKLHQAEHNHKDKRLTLRIGYAINLAVFFLSSLHFLVELRLAVCVLCRSGGNWEESQMESNSRKVVQAGILCVCMSFCFHSLRIWFNAWKFIFGVFCVSARSIKSKKQQHAQCQKKHNEPNYFCMASVFRKPQHRREKKKTIILESQEGNPKFKIKASKCNAWTTKKCYTLKIFG